MNEYARVSAVEIFEQVSVKSSQKVVEAIKASVHNREFDDVEQLKNYVGRKLDGVNLDNLMDELFEIGVIGNLDKVAGKRRYFWRHRQEERLDREMKVIIHPGLWNYFNIRHR